MALAIAATGCRSVPALPPVDLSETGWRTRHGQAVWQPAEDAPEIAGELLVATNANRAFVQFTKTPLPFVIAQIAGDAWKVEFPVESRTFSGRGRLPARVAWLHLARGFLGIAPPPKWVWHETPDGRWELKNTATGERLQGYFNP